MKPALLLILLLSAGCAQPLRSAVHVSIGCSMVAHGATWTLALGIGQCAAFSAIALRNAYIIQKAAP